MTRSLYKYVLRHGTHLLKLRLRVEVTPSPTGLRPAAISVLADTVVIGTLTPADIERTLREWGEAAAEPSSRL